MNEEEIIKNIEDMLLHAETNLLDYEALAIQGLLDLYNKEKLNSLSLSEQLNKEKEKNKKIEDKIKGKIKELNELLKETQKELGSASIEFNIYAHQKDILNCLLEE